MRNYLR